MTAQYVRATHRDVELEAELRQSEAQRFEKIERAGMQRANHRPTHSRQRRSPPRSASPLSPAQAATPRSGPSAIAIHSSTTSGPIATAWRCDHDG